MLTIAYFTSRKQPCIEWFFDSLHIETGGDYSGIKVVVVDFYAESRPVHQLAHCPILHVTPKPTVWQGKCRLTSVDYFAASNARNTAICLADDGWIAFVDDVSVLLPGWLSRIKLAQEKNYIVLGSYQKVSDLIVENGVVTHFKEIDRGIDSRWKFGTDEPVNLGGGALFGASLAGPVQAFLDINGFDEDCDSLGGEDTGAGIMLERQGHLMLYDRQMKTYEWEEGHFLDTPMRRCDPGVSPNDKSHKMLDMLINGSRNRAPNYFGPDGIAGLRKKVLAGEPFPLVGIPEHDWFTGKPLREL